MLPATANSSTATLTSPPVQRAQTKNYEAAFGALSTTYGLGPGVLMPTPPPKTPTSQRSPSSPTTTGKLPTVQSQKQKDNDTAFASLLSCLGFDGAQPPRSGNSK